MYPNIVKIKQVMPTATKKPFQLNLTTLIAALGICLVSANFFFLNVYTIRKHAEDAKYSGPYPEPGSQFANFKNLISNQTKSIGYITDKSMSREKNDGTFLQAQYYLAPVILKLQDENQPLFILDSTDIDYIIKTIRRLNAKRLSSNEYGQALMVRLPQ